MVYGPLCLPRTWSTLCALRIISSITYGCQIPIHIKLLILQSEQHSFPPLLSTTSRSMAPNIMSSAPRKVSVAEVRAAAPVMPKVDWKKSPNMRKLYFYAAILCVASATTGYDG